MMITALTDSICNYMTHKQLLKCDDPDKIHRIAHAILDQSSKLILLFAAFSLCGLQKPFVLALIPAALFRLITGARAFKTYWGALLFAGLFYVICIALYHFIPLNYTLAMALGVFSLVTAFLVVPIARRSHQTFSAKKRLSLKILACLFVLFHMTGFALNLGTFYFSIATWGIFLQSVCLFVD